MEGYERDAFTSEVNEFMQRGDRNTGSQGYDLCMRVAHLESEHHNSSHKPTCYEIYKNGSISLDGG